MLDLQESPSSGKVKKDRNPTLWQRLTTVVSDIHVAQEKITDVSIRLDRAEATVKDLIANHLQ